MPWVILLCRRRSEQRAASWITTCVGSLTAAETSPRFEGMVLVRREHADRVAEAVADRQVPGALGFVGGATPMEVSDLEVEIALTGGTGKGVVDGVKASVAWFGRRK